jgi:hypothetical protein
LRPVIFLSRVVAAVARVVAGFYCLAIQHRGAGLRGPALGQPRFLDQSAVQPRPDTVVLPAPDLGVDGLPGREVVRQHAPRTAAAEEIPVGVEDLPQGDFTRPAAELLGRQKRFQALPLGIGQIGGVGFAFHGPGFY